MNHLIITAVAIGILSLSACDKSVPDNLPNDPTKTPLPQSSIGNGTGQSGDDAIQTEPVAPGDTEIQNTPVRPNGDSTIIIPPPVANMPPEVMPDNPK